MILEPIFDAVLMKIVFEVAGKSHNTLFRCELSQANAALILISETLCVPLNREHF